MLYLRYRGTSPIPIEVDCLTPDNLAGKSGADMDRFAESDTGMGDLEFAALIRKLDKVDTTWRH